jgi:glycine hydroxymethyltransferase
MANELLNRGYNIISNGTENHCILIDLRNKNITGKEAEFSLGISDITVNKNMVPFDDKSPFVTSGIRIGTAAITTRGINENEIIEVANLIDQNISNFQNEKNLLKIKTEVNELMSPKPLFKW